MSNGGLPEFRDLLGLLDTIHQGRLAMYQALRARDDLHSSHSRGDWAYRERFNIRPCDVNLIRNNDDDPMGGDAGAASVNSYEHTWANHLRFML